MPPKFVDEWARHSTGLTIKADGSGSTFERAYLPCGSAPDCQFNATLRVKGVSATKVSIQFTKVWYTYDGKTMTPNVGQNVELQQYFPRSGESATATLDGQNRLVLRLGGRLESYSAAEPERFTFCGKLTPPGSRMPCGA